MNNPQLEADSFHLSTSNIKGTLLCHMKKFSKAYIISIPVKLYNARLPQQARKIDPKYQAHLPPSYLHSK
jgi:hypothetical protein